jgi:ADP-ribosyl-[dinitrogen reductase] hydrolase
MPANTPVLRTRADRLRGALWGMFVGDALAMPDRHNDTYAESYHRDFFANYARGVPPERCAGAEGHDTASIGGLVSLPPVLFAAMHFGAPTAASAAALSQLRLTHRSAKLERFALEFCDILMHLLCEPTLDRFG